MRRYLLATVLLFLLCGQSHSAAQGLMPAVLTTGAVSLTVVNAGSCTTTSTGCAVLSVSGLSYMYVQITGTFVGTLQFETTVDGTTWVADAMTPIGGGSAVTSATSTGLWTGKAAFRYRVRLSASSSGTAVVTAEAKAN